MPSYEADTDSGDKSPARRAPPGVREPSPDKMNAGGGGSVGGGGGKPKPSDASPRPIRPEPERPANAMRNTFTGKSTLSL